MAKLVDTALIKQAVVDIENIYDEIEIDDMDFEKEGENYYFRYPCPCGDRFKVSL